MIFPIDTIKKTWYDRIDEEELSSSHKHNKPQRILSKSESRIRRIIGFHGFYGILSEYLNLTIPS
jgi:hypothetical protein